MRTDVFVILGAPNRCSQEPLEELRLGAVDEDDALHDWLLRIDTGKHESERLAAGDLFSDGAGEAILSLPGHTGAGQPIKIRFATAGWGLIQPQDLILPHSATFSGGGPDSLAHFDFESTDWWAALTDAQGWSIARLARAHPNAIFAILADEPTLEVLRRDLMEADEALAGPDQFLIFTTGVEVFGELTPRLVDCPANLTSILQGPAASVAARVLRRLLLEIGDFSGKSVRDQLKTWLKLAPGDAPELSDDELVDFIRHHSPATKAQLLRRLQADGFSCSKPRFSRLYDEVATRERQEFLPGFDDVPE